MKNIEQGGIEALLLERGYGTAGAKSTAADLARVIVRGDEDLRSAAMSWLRGEGLLPDVSEGGYSLSALVARGLRYPAAIVFLDWLREDPAEAIKSISIRM